MLVARVSRKVRKGVSKTVLAISIVSALVFIAAVMISCGSQTEQNSPERPKPPADVRSFKISDRKHVKGHSKDSHVTLGNRALLWHQAKPTSAQGDGSIFMASGSPGKGYGHLGEKGRAITVDCVDIDPHTPCIYERWSQAYSGIIWTHHASGSTTLESAVRAAGQPETDPYQRAENSEVQSMRA